MILYQTVKADVGFVKQNTQPYLKISNVIMIKETVVWSATSLHNKMFLPFAAVYNFKSRKNGKNSQNYLETNQKYYRCMKHAQNVQKVKKS